MNLIKQLPLALLFTFLLCSCDKQPKMKKEPFTFKGKVTDCQTGNPIAGAQVTVDATHVTWVVNNERTVGTAITDNQGNYAINPDTNNIFSNHPRDYYYISAKAEGYIPMSTSIRDDSVRKTMFPVYNIDIALCK